MGTALTVLMWTNRALAGLALLSDTGWIGDPKANEIIGKIPRLALPITAQIEELQASVSELLDREGPISADELEEINQRATSAEAELIAVFEHKVGPSA